MSPWTSTIPLLVPLIDSLYGKAQGVRSISFGVFVQSTLYFISRVSSSDEMTASVPSPLSATTTRLNLMMILSSVKVHVAFVTSSFCNLPNPGGLEFAFGETRYSKEVPFHEPWSFVFSF